MEFHTAADLFGNYRLIKPNGRAVNERAALIGWFADEVKRKPVLIGIRLAHYKTIDDLYGLQSAYKDRLTRNGKETADKYFWYITRTNETVQ